MAIAAIWCRDQCYSVVEVEIHMFIIDLSASSLLVEKRLFILQMRIAGHSHPLVFRAYWSMTLRITKQLAWQPLAIFRQHDTGKWQACDWGISGLTMVQLLYGEWPGWKVNCAVWGPECHGYTDVWRYKRHLCAGYMHPQLVPASDQRHTAHCSCRPWSNCL